MRRGPDVGAVYEINQRIITVGRGAKNNIVIADNDVSRDHCRFIRTPAGYELQDLGSDTGTFVNGQRVEDGRLLDASCVIELGDSITFVYELDTLAPQPESSTSIPIVPNETMYLILKMGPEEARVYALDDDLIVIGRDLSNDIVVQDPEVSRRHVRLRRTPAGYQVEDAGSTNGTHVNGEKLEGSRRLKINDVIELASNSRLTYVRDPNTIIDTPPETSPSAPTASQALRPGFMNMRERLHTTRLGTGIKKGALVNHIFVAYSRDDWESVVVPLLVMLEDSGIETWSEQYLTQGGDDWRAAVEQALNECWLLVLVVSPEALESRPVKLQYRYFLNREKPIIPFGYKGVEKLPPEFGALPVVPYDPENARRSFQRLILEILHKRV